MEQIKEELGNINTEIDDTNYLVRELLKKIEQEELDLREEEIDEVIERLYDLSRHIMQLNDYIDTQFHLNQQSQTTEQSDMIISGEENEDVGITGIEFEEIEDF